MVKLDEKIRLLENPLSYFPKRKLDGKKEGDVWKDIERAAMKVTGGYESPFGKVIGIHNAMIKGGELGIVSEAGKAETRPMGSLRGIEVFHYKKGDCNEKAFLYIIMARYVGLKAHVVELFVKERERPQLHACACVFIKGDFGNIPREVVYKRFETDSSFRKECLKKLDIQDSEDLHLILVDPSLGGFGRHYKEIKLLTDVEATALHYQEEASIHFGQGKLEKAIEESKLAVELDSTRYVPHVILGKAYHKQEKIKDAIKEYKITIKLNPKSADAHHCLGLAYADQGKIDEAIKEYKTATLLDPEDPAIHYYLAHAYFEKGGIENIEKAIKECELALKFDPKYENAKTLLRVAKDIKRVRGIKR